MSGFTGEEGRMMVLLDASTGRVLASDVREARTPWRRAVGYLFRRSIGSQEALWFPGCTAVHTLGMRVAIDVIFLDARGRVVSVAANVRPGRPIVTARGAASVVEAASGFAASRGITAGNPLRFHSQIASVAA